jgi:spore maturation protein CgeB
LIKSLARLGWQVTFYEPDAFDRQRHRDLGPPAWARSVVWPATEAGLGQVVAEAAQADVVVKASGFGVFDRELLDGALLAARPGAIRVFWDVDAPATLAELASDANHVLHRALHDLDLVLTYGGGPPVRRGYCEAGARAVETVYNGLDPDTHFPALSEPRFAGDLGLLANRLPDREERVDAFFMRVATTLPRRRFVLGGNGWADRPLPDNVHAVGHVYVDEHNAFNASTTAVLNVARDSMAAVGWSPATRVFEAAGAGACIITDEWAGIEDFFTPDEEILVAADGGEVAAIVDGLSKERARAIGAAARDRALRDHTYASRAALVDRLLRDLVASRRSVVAA